MLLHAYLVLSAIAAVSPLDVEYQGTRHVLQQFDRAGREPPRGDRALAAAARMVAQEALKSATGADLYAISQTVSDAQGFDPNPRTLVLRASPASELFGALLLREYFGVEPATHLGLAAAFDGDRGAIAVLLTNRRVELDAFPRKLPAAGGSRPLCGALREGFERPEVYSTLPSGAVDRLEPSRDGRRFCAVIPFPAVGPYTLEVVAHGPSGGAEVVGLFFVDVGGTWQRDRHARLPEPTSVAEARAAVVQRINALRRAHQLSALSPDDFLNKIAQRYSEQMSGQGFFGHVAPEGDTMRSRLRAAGYTYQLAGENLAVASGPLAAHFAIEQSPGHRKNLLEPQYSQVGIGVAFQKRQGREQVLVTELYATPSREVAVATNAPLQREDPSLRTRALEEPGANDYQPEPAYRSLAERRGGLQLAPLERSQVLEVIALDHAQLASELSDPRLELSGDARVFAQLHGLEDLAVEIVHASRKDELPRPAGSAAAHRQRVGIAGVKGVGDDERYWVALVYGSAR